MVVPYFKEHLVSGAKKYTYFHLQQATAASSFRREVTKMRANEKEQHVEKTGCYRWVPEKEQILHAAHT